MELQEVVHSIGGLCSLTGVSPLVEGLSVFKRRRFPVEIILVCIRWYCKYGISYRDLAEMMQERAVEVEPSTIMRWVHRYARQAVKLDKTSQVQVPQQQYRSGS